MKSMNWKLMTMALAASFTVVTTSCENNEENNDNTQGTYELSQDITTDLTLEAGKEYTLKGGIHVKNGATLTIPEGVTIIAQYDDVVDYILVEQGAKIEALGTKENPIVMTSTKKEPGAWGGIHICGYAHTNAEGGKGSSEIGNATYGGDNDADNSGTLRYVRLEYTGYAFDEETESNGISFYGVGNGTTVEYVQAYKGSDDGLEFFGGSVNVSHAVVTSCSDDSFDWTEGWNGKGQFLVAYQEQGTSLGYACDCLMECDNNGKNFDATPVAHPILSNLTLIGNGGDGQGVRLRAGTEVEIYNAIIANKGKVLTVETTQTENSFNKAENPSVLEYVEISGELQSKENIYTNDNFINTTGNKANQTFNLSENYIGTISGGKNTSSVDSFFKAAEYKGAVAADNDWTKGWTL